jgi:hypothetical protein
MLDTYTPKPVTDDNCFYKMPGATYCPVEVDVSYIKKSYDKTRFRLIYNLT